MSGSFYKFSGKYGIGNESESDVYFEKVRKKITEWNSGQQQFAMNSSGSTGDPKLIQLRRSQMVHSARITGKALNLPENSSVLIALNTDLIAGFMMLVRTLELNWNATVVHPAADPLCDLPEDFACDFAALTPMQLTTLLVSYSKEIISRKFRKILLGGAPADALLMSQIQDIPTEIYQSYGMTETVSHVALRRINGTDPSEDYLLLDDIEAGTDDRGCLHLAGTVTDHQMIQTNDLVEFTGKRTFRWLGRADNIINSGGIKIQLDKVDKEIGRALATMQLSLPFFTWHIPDPVLGQKLILLIQASPSENLVEELKKHIQLRLSKYEIPKEVCFLKEFIKTPSGKIDKAATVKTYINLH